MPLPCDIDTELARQVLGMQIDRNETRFMFEQMLITRERHRVIAIRLAVLQFADVMRHDRLAIAQQAERVFLLSTHREDRRRSSKITRQTQRRRCKTARAAQQARYA